MILLLFCKYWVALIRESYLDVGCFNLTFINTLALRRKPFDKLREQKMAVAELVEA